MVILVAPASSEFLTRPAITLLRQVMTREDLIWATTSPGSGLMDMAGGTSLGLYLLGCAWCDVVCLWWGAIRNCCGVRVRFPPGLPSVVHHDQPAAGGCSCPCMTSATKHDHGQTGRHGCKLSSGSFSRSSRCRQPCHCLALRPRLPQIVAI